MKIKQIIISGITKISRGKEKEGHYSRLYWKFVLITLACSIIPLFLVGWGIYNYYSGFSRIRMENYFKDQVGHHRKIIDMFLKERTYDLKLILFTNSCEYLQQQENIEKIFNTLNIEGSFFTDLGLIYGDGRHLAYAGPYDLIKKNYSNAVWFKEVMKKGVYISDMFTGFRNVPHFIIAVRRSDNNGNYILRATIDTEYFRSLVENVKMGKTGEVYLSNQEGILQTTPRYSGKIMDKAVLPAEFFHEESGIGILESGGKYPGSDFPRQLVAYTWLENPRWKLVIKQNYSEAFKDVDHANRAALIFLHLSLIAITVISLISARYMINAIKKWDEKADRLNRQLIEASKLASLGELSAGVAHEINNPLAIILTENQIIKDSLDELSNLDEKVKTELSDSLSAIQSQILRCTNITKNLLKFSRHINSSMEQVNLNTFLEEIIQLMEGRSKVINIKFDKNLERNIPFIVSDPSKLQQVFLNMINNAVDAHEGKPHGKITISTSFDSISKGVEISINDTGSGIAPENLGKIFEPFFTTKSVGKGTGLGLSISYSIIKSLGGDISVQSELGKGTEFKIILPYKQPEGHKDNLNSTKESRE
ncbi:MAG: GHKL domain-containing protein [Desulfobacterium sp.]|nr:GHKL domain-containing protein [Desulfobacterium sp.]